MPRIVLESVSVSPLWTTNLQKMKIRSLVNTIDIKNIQRMNFGSEKQRFL